MIRVFQPFYILVTLLPVLKYFVRGRTLFDLKRLSRLPLLNNYIAWRHFFEVITSYHLYMSNLKEICLRRRSLLLLRKKVDYAVRLPSSWIKLTFLIVNVPMLDSFKQLLDTLCSPLFSSLFLTTLHHQSTFNSTVVFYQNIIFFLDLAYQLCFRTGATAIGVHVLTRVHHLFTTLC